MASLQAFVKSFMAITDKRFTSKGESVVEVDTALSSKKSLRWFKGDGEWVKNGGFIVVTLWLCQNSYWKWPFIVDFPMKNGDFP